MIEQETDGMWCEEFSKPMTDLDYVSKDVKLTDEELAHIADMLLDYKPGTLEHSIYEKVRKK